MNLKQITLDEMELPATLCEEGLACLLHTILFIRAPGPVRPVVSFPALITALLDVYSYRMSTAEN
jgi:hypothetical protein